MVKLHISHVLKALGFLRVIQKKVKAQINRNYRKLNLVTGSGAAPGATTKPKARCRYGAVRVMLDYLRDGWSPEQIAKQELLVELPVNSEDVVFLSELNVIQPSDSDVAEVCSI